MKVIAVPVVVVVLKIVILFIDYIENYRVVVGVLKTDRLFDKPPSHRKLLQIKVVVVAVFLLQI